MSANGIATQPIVLLVTGINDDASQRLTQTLSQNGATVYYVSEIYAALAGLSRGEPISHLIVDTRWLDEYEMQFLKLAPKYFKKATFLVPAFEGAPSHRCHISGRYQVLSVPELIRNLLGDGFEALLEEPVRIAGDYPEPVAASDRNPQQGVMASAGRLSTDGGPESVSEEPAMHDAVRQRMGGLGRGGVVRRPPGADAKNLTAPRNDDAVSRGRYGTVTPEEMAELLKGDQTQTPEEIETRRRQFGGGR